MKTQILAVEKMRAIISTCEYRAEVCIIAFEAANNFPGCNICAAPIR